MQSGDSKGVYELEGEWTSIKPADFTSAHWDYSWDALDNHKVNGGPTGYVEYQVSLPEQALDSSTCCLEVIFEAGAKVVLGKDKELATVKAHDISYMHGAKLDPGMNINSYFMTDEKCISTRADITVDGESLGELYLPDDPADSRGILSWHYQSNDRKLVEAGSYGYLQRVQIPSRQLARVIDKGGFTLRLSAAEGGLAIYGRNAGRYPVDLVVHWHS